MAVICAGDIISWLIPFFDAQSSDLNLAGRDCVIFCDDASPSALFGATTAERNDSEPQQSSQMTG